MQGRLFVCTEFEYSVRFDEFFRLYRWTDFSKRSWRQRVESVHSMRLVCRFVKWRPFIHAEKLEWRSKENKWKEKGDAENKNRIIWWGEEWAMRILLCAWMILVLFTTPGIAQKQIRLMFAGDVTLGSEEYLREKDFSLVSFAERKGFSYFFENVR